MTVVQADFESLARIIGTKVVVLQPPRTWTGGEGGTDIDCLVWNLDRSWPLRLPAGWRLCQALHYRHFATSWYLARGEETLHVDTTDVDGLDAVVALLRGTGDSLSPVARAIYLTDKRVRKKMLTELSWGEIASLAQVNPEEYTKQCAAVFGPGAGREMANCGLKGNAPDDRAWRRARRGRLIATFRNPRHGLRVGFREAKRLVGRVVHPTGMYVLIVGPDGSGKSTFALALLSSCKDLFRRTSHVHWRPGLLPAPGRVARREPGDPSRPHERPLHGFVLSHALLLYQWLDFFLGGWVRIKWNRLRTGLVVVERGWWDIAVDPHRYRLSVSAGAVKALGRLLPRPDLVVVMSAQPGVMVKRKSEISEGELARQMDQWRNNPAPSPGPTLVLDAEDSIDAITAEARGRVARDLEVRTLRKSGAGWTGITTKAFRRWAFPRGPSGVAASGLLVKNPVTPRGYLAWGTSRVLAQAGMFALLPRGEAPPEIVREELAGILNRGDSFSVMKANHPGRYVALVISENGRPRAVVKIASDDAGLAALDREAHGLQRIARLVNEPLSAPALIERADRRLVMEAVAWRPRLRPWKLSEEVAEALGRFYRAGVSTNPNHGAGHGDFAPWNLLRVGDSWVLVDWEDASLTADPFFDVLHYFIQSYSLLGRPDDASLLDGVEGRGWIGKALIAYGRGAEIDALPGRDVVGRYLTLTGARLDPSREDARRGLEARRRLLAQITGSE